MSGKLEVTMSIVPALIALAGALAVFFLYRTDDARAEENAVENEKYIRMEVWEMSYFHL